MKILAIMIMLIMASGFAMAAKPIISISITPTNGEAESEYNMTVTNNANIVLSEITFFFGTDDIVPITTSTCKYGQNGLILKSSEQATCTFKVPQLKPQSYNIGVKSNKGRFQNTQMFNLINSSAYYQKILAKIKIGTKIPDNYGQVIGDGKYQGYIVNDVPINNCKAKELTTNQIDYDVVVTIESGKIKEITRGKTTEPTMEICLSNKAIEKIENTQEYTTTIIQQLESGEMSYSVNDPIQKLKFSFLQFLALILDGEYRQIAKILSFAK